MTIIGSRQPLSLISSGNARRFMTMSIVDFDVENFPLGEYLVSALESLLKNFAKVRTYEA